MVRKICNVCFSLCLISTGVIGPLRAEEPEQPSNGGQEAESTEPAASEERPASSPAEDRKSSDLDEALLERLTGGRQPQEEPSTTDDPAPTEIVTPDGEAPDPLERAIQSMRNVSQRIGEKRDTGEETRKMQEQIVRDLAELIQQAQQQQQNSGNSQQQQAQRRQQNRLQQQENGAQDQERRPQQAENQPQPGESGRRNKDAGQSTERTDEAEKANAELDQREFLVKDVWGHLPPAIREQMLTIYRDKTLPKYEDLVREYFRALAESNRKRRQE